MTRQTYLERRWPNTPVFQDIAEQWCADLSRLLLDLIWRGYDLLVTNDLQNVPFSLNNEAKEESLNFLLAVRIDQCKTGDEPFYVSHQPPEQTRRKRGRGKSPQPDIGFVLYEYPRSVWPMEGKMLSDDQDVAAYLAEIETNLLSGRYATFSREGAMLGYLLAGDPQRTLEGIGNNLGTTLRDHPRFTDRPHKLSEHLRARVPHINSPNDFVCHHLILRIACG